MKLNAVVEIELDMEKGETLDQAKARLFDLLFDGLCRNSPCEFSIQNTYEVKDQK